MATESKKSWETPKLDILDIEQTLSGPIDSKAEGVYTDPPFTGLPNTNGILSS